MPAKAKAKNKDGEWLPPGTKKGTKKGANVFKERLAKKGYSTDGEWLPPGYKNTGPNPFAGAAKILGKKTGTKTGTKSGTKSGTTAKPKKTTVTVETAEQPKAAQPAKTTVTVETTTKTTKTATKRTASKRTPADKEKLKAQREKRKQNHLKTMPLTAENLAGIRTTTLLQIFNLRNGSNLTMDQLKKTAGSNMRLVRSTLLEQLGQPRLKLRKQKKDPNAPKEPKTRATKKADYLKDKVLTYDLVNGVSTQELLKLFNLRNGSKLTMADLKKAAGVKSNNSRIIRSTLLEHLGLK